MTYEEWAATVERGETITPEMAFAAGQKSGWGYRSGARSRDAQIAELTAALEAMLKASGVSLTYHLADTPEQRQAKEAINLAMKL